MKTAKVNQRKITVNGEEVIIPKQFEIEDLPNIGWIQFECMGTENIYFSLEDGTQGYCKL